MQGLRQRGAPEAPAGRHGWFRGWGKLNWPVGFAPLANSRHAVQQRGKIDRLMLRQRTGIHKPAIPGIHDPPDLANPNRHENLMRRLATIGHCCIPTGRQIMLQLWGRH